MDVDSLQETIHSFEYRLRSKLYFPIKKYQECRARSCYLTDRASRLIIAPIALAIGYCIGIGLIVTVNSFIELAILAKGYQTLITGIMAIIAACIALFIPVLQHKFEKERTSKPFRVKCRKLADNIAENLMWCQIAETRERDISIAIKNIKQFQVDFISEAIYGYLTAAEINDCEEIKKKFSQCIGLVEKERPIECYKDLLCKCAEIARLLARISRSYSFRDDEIENFIKEQCGIGRFFRM